jgi:uncharacterized C2H2 Zn-finger protein
MAMAMAQAHDVMRSFGMLTKKRLTLKALERRLAGEERQAIESVGRMLSPLGYRVVAANGQRTPGTVPKPTASRPRRRLARQNLKCPKCGRRFAFVMHLARHTNTMHGAKKRTSKKAAA